MPIVSVKNADHYVWATNCEGWHLAASKNLSVIQERVPKGSCETRHFHKKAEQFFYVLSGIATLEVAGEIHILHPHEGFHIPAGIAHTLSNEHEKDLEFLVVSTPPSHGDRENVPQIRVEP
ncbi:cupin domain-containing protein [Sulfurimonas sp. HSL1-2]|uniref:cupin domain-containing protein n=1 Tax=Thiomicrolovo zhangzhouensis TaxID=3131933 RepID=UPI0031FA2E64